MQSAVRFERIDLETEGSQLGMVTFDRPEERNPIDWDTLGVLRRGFTELIDDPAVRAVAITGTGPAFSAGGDMKKYQQLQRDPVGFPKFLSDFHSMMGLIASAPIPFVALVNGVAVAGGLELILACDLAIASESARIGDAHQPFGQMGGGGVLSLLAPVVGIQRARELLFTGRIVDASEALELGLVVDVVPAEQLLQAGISFANRVAAHSALAIANAKQVVNANFWADAHVESALSLELERTARYCLTSEDAPIGLRAFSNRETPKFVGR